MRRAALRRTATVGAGIGVVVLLAAGCGAATNELNPSQETLKTATKAPLGKVLVDDEGQTVYLFEKDEKGESYCSGACASVWPPVTTSAMPKVEGQLDPSKVSTFKRDDGLTQIAYNGHPLYYYQADTDPEDAYGQDIEQFGAEWYAVTPSGSKAEAKSKSGGGSGGS
jgi:predicted lipoprotein with Yx(FWY)xxD motif